RSGGRGGTRTCWLFVLFSFVLRVEFPELLPAQCTFSTPLDAILDRIGVGIVVLHSPVVKYQTDNTSTAQQCDSQHQSRQDATQIAVRTLLLGHEYDEAREQGNPGKNEREDGVAGPTRKPFSASRVEHLVLNPATVRTSHRVAFPVELL